MGRFLLSAFIGVLCFTLPFCLLGETKHKTITVIPLTKKYGEIPIHPVNDAIVQVKKGNNFICTAFIIDANYAITAGHCLTEDDELIKDELTIVAPETHFEVKAVPAGVAARSDFGLITGDFNEFKMIKIDTEHYKFIEKKLYATLGYGYGSNNLEVNLFMPITNHGFGVYGVGYLVPGDSGGPVIDLETVTAIGINSAVEDGGILIYPLQGFLAAFGIE